MTVDGRLSAGKHEIRVWRRFGVIVMGATTLLATSLHAIEAGIWAIAYRLLGALPGNKSAMLYSLGAITSYGHRVLDLESHWRLMGSA
jgi:hypothetical protein